LSKLFRFFITLLEIDEKYILQFSLGTESTFYKAVIISHFKHLLFDDFIDIYNLTLFDLFEKVKNKKIILKGSPMKGTFL